MFLPYWFITENIKIMKGIELKHSSFVVYKYHISSLCRRTQLDKGLDDGWVDCRRVLGCSPRLFGIAFKELRQNLHLWTFMINAKKKKHIEQVERGSAIDLGQI